MTTYTPCVDYGRNRREYYPQATSRSRDKAMRHAEREARKFPPESQAVAKVEENERE